MKILIPYDGSQNAEAALQKLQTAGFGEHHEALILVSDVFLPETSDEFWRAVADRRRRMQMSGICSHVPARRRLEEERFLLCELRGRIPKMFPSWETRFAVLPGESLASSEILEIARMFQPDVLVLGQKSVSAAENTAFGGGARRVAKEAGCRIFFAGDDEQPFLKEIETRKRKTRKRKSAPAAVAFDKQVIPLAFRNEAATAKNSTTLAAAAA